jgi:hypothetical protein
LELKSKSQDVRFRPESGGMQKAQLFTYHGDDGANHGVLYQHPLWTQEHIFMALN